MVRPILCTQLLVPALSLTVSDSTIVEESAILSLSFFNSKNALSVSLALRVDFSDVAASLVVNCELFGACKHDVNWSQPPLTPLKLALLPLLQQLPLDVARLEGELRVERRLLGQKAHQSILLHTVGPGWVWQHLQELTDFGLWPVIREHDCCWAKGRKGVEGNAGTILKRNWHKLVTDWLRRLLLLLRDKFCSFELVNVPHVIQFSFKKC